MSVGACKLLYHSFVFFFVTQENQYKDATPLQTKLCKAIAVVLGNTAEVQKLDRARRCHKSNPNHKERANDYLSKLALVQSNVLSKQLKLKRRFDAWEREFFVTHNCLLALLEDINNDLTASELNKQLKYARALLREWKMDALG